MSSNLIANYFSNSKKASEASVEENLFSFEAAQGDAESIEYFKVTLKYKFGEFEAGRFFDSAILNTEKATMSFYDAEVLKGRFSVQLNIITDLLNQDESESNEHGKQSFSNSR